MDLENLDFSKICRVCLKEGVMLSLFKVNISKKMMLCASVQVWQNDGLPPQICNKCLAKLHISFQFKRQCEKSDAKLRQYLLSLKSDESEDDDDKSDDNEEADYQADDSNETSNQKQIEDNIQLPSQSNSACVFLECAPIIDLNASQEAKFECQSIVEISDHGKHVQNFIPAAVQSPQEVAYSLQEPVGYTIQGVPVYNGTTNTYSIPLIQNNIITQPIIATSQVQLPIATVQEFEAASDKDDKKNKISKVKKEFDENNKQCPTCKKVFDSLAKVTRHMKTHSTDMPYKCNVCNKAFSHSGNFKIHMRMHTGERPYRCKICDKGWRQSQDLAKHMRTHTGERPHKCTHCPRAFTTSSNLAAHIRIHTGERPYVCCVCQKAFCQSNELTKHMRTHTGEKSHICDICNKGFNGSSTLIVHRRLHTGERPYVCSYCPKSFAQSSYLSTHMKKHVDEKVSNIKEEFNTNMKNQLDMQENNEDLTNRNELSENLLVIKE